MIKTRKNLVVLLFTICSLALQAQTTYYVSTSGDDGNDGLTESTPWRTFQYAEDNAITPGDTIALKKGDTWVTTLALGIQHGGNDGNPIVWDGGLWGTGDNAVIQASGDKPVTNYAICAVTGCQNVTVQNITFDGNSMNCYGVVIGAGTDGVMAPGSVQDSENNIIIQDCEILNVGDNNDDYCIAILIQTWNTDMSNIIIRRNFVNGATNHAIAAYQGREKYGATAAKLTGLYIGYNTVTNFGLNGDGRASGILMTQEVIGGTVEHNTVSQGSGLNGPGIIIAGEDGYYPTGAIIRYNDCRMLDQPAFSVQNGGVLSAKIYGNKFYTDNASGKAAVWIIISGSPDYTGTNFEFYFNTIVVNQGVSYMDDSSTPGICTFSNNLVINTGLDAPCVVINANASTTHSYNAYHKTGVGDLLYAIDGSYIYTSGVQGWEPTAVVADPLLSDLAGFNWHLQDESPAIGKGIYIPEITEDIDSVPMSDPPNIGCYQAIAGQKIPVFISSVVEDISPIILEMNYSDSLNSDSIPASSAFDVQVNSINRNVNSVAINGTKVQLTLDSTIVYGDVVTVAYTQPALNPLQSTTGGLVEDMSAQQSTNHVNTNSPIYITSVVEDGSPTILEITYDKTLDNLVVPPNSAFNVQINSVRKIVNSIEIIGVKALLTLASPVVNGDIVTIAYTKPASNPLQSPSGDEVFSMIAQSVTNNCLSGGYAIPPVYVSSVIDDATPALLAMTYDTELDNDSVPVPSAFNVMVNSVSRSVNAVVISGTKVHLTLDSAAVFGDTITVAYNVPGSEQLQSTSGGIAASLNAQMVTNNINDVISINNPIYVSSAVEDTTPTILEITYDKDLDSLSVPGISAFDVQVYFSPMTVTSVSIVSNTVRLELVSPIIYGDIITVAYVKPAGDKIQTTLGDEAASISPQTVTNNVKEVVIDPVYINSVVENATPNILEMTYDLSLDNNFIPAPTDFDVQVNSLSRTINSVAISGTNVRLILNSTIVYDDIITVSYIKPASNPLQTASGGEAASINAQPVTNNVDEIIINTPPVAVVDYESSSYSGFVSEIDASGSYDPDNDPLIYSWTAPDNVSVSSTDNATIEYLSPVVSEAEVIEFSLSVSDGYSNKSEIIPINILPYKPELSLAKINNIIASDYQEPNYPDNVIDDNIETWWSAEGSDQWLIFELEDSFRISHIEIAFLIGQRRFSYFDIYASKDSINWEPILLQASSCNFSGDYQVFDFPETVSDTAFSFIKLVGQANSQDGWNSYSEFKIFGTPFTNELKINIYPNPASEYINIVIIYPPIDTLEDPPITLQILRIFNISGMMVYEESVVPGIRYLQIPVDFAPGIYGIQMVSGKLVSAVKKLIVAN